MSEQLMILVAGPYRSGTNDDPALIQRNVDAMEDMAKAMKEIRRRMLANRDLPGIASEAARIGALAERLPELFPPGSNGRPSETLTSVCQQWPKFQAEGERLAQEAGKLGPGRSILRPQAKVVAQLFPSNGLL